MRFSTSSPTWKTSGSPQASARYTRAISLVAMLSGGALQAQAAPLVGEWGGQHLSVVVADTGATLEFDCAHGQIDQAVRPDRRGRFTARGSFTPEKGGPVGGPPAPQPALYTGRVKGDRMTVATKLVKPPRTIGPYSVTRGNPPRLVKCL